MSVRAKSASLTTFGTHRPQDPLALVGSTELSGAVWRWASVGFARIDLASASNLLSDANGTNLVLAPNVLVSGQWYSFRATVVTGTAVGTADISVRVSGAPSVGICAINVTTRSNLGRRMGVLCSMWTDDYENLPLRSCGHSFILPGRVLFLTPALVSLECFCMQISMWFGNCHGLRDFDKRADR